MTDRALTEKQVDELADLNELVINGLGRADVCVLIASHRLVQKQVAGLEQQVEVQRLNLRWFDRQLQEAERDD